MNKKFIQLPRGYISQSQVTMWKQDPERYKSIYFDNDKSKRISNEGMEYGKIVASALENEVDTDDLLTDSAMLLLPKYDVRDKEIVVEWKTPHGWLKVLGKPDMLDSKTFAFREIKTGKTKWTQNKANKHFQLKFYAMLIYLKYGKMLHETFLDWIETEVVRTELDGFPIETTQPTGRVESFKVVFSTNDILQTMAETLKVAKEIETAYIIHLSNPHVPF